MFAFAMLTSTMARVAGTTFALVLLASIPHPARAGSPDAVGGGFTDSGLEGAYFASSTLEGEPSFVRRDVRIDFDWTDGRLVGGSTSLPYRDYPSQGFSVRWTGQILARFTEPYTFFGRAGGGIRIRIREAGTPAWVVVVDRWDEAGPYESPPTPLNSGKPYDIEVEYRAADTNPACTLRWRSESTPDEVIDPVVQQGLNAATWGRYVWADLVKSARYGDATHIDEKGWPTKSGVELVASEMEVDDLELAGTYLLHFQGKAQVEQRCCNQPVFRADGQTFQRTLPKGAGYDQSSNVTSALMTVDGSRFMLYFNDAQRASGRQDDGVAEIHLMRPLRPRSQDHHRLDEVVYRPFKKAVASHFTTLRWLDGANADVSGQWGDRAKPNHAFFATEGGQENWEYLVLLANETGKDLYITTPIAADDEYFHKLALLLRHGSDGRDPYARPTPNPVYPPLNPNLRVYVEVGNEIWNWDFPSTRVAQRLSKAEKEAGSETWKAVDFDGAAGNPEHIGAIRRWHALRTVACSKAFRNVFGDEQMGSRVRVLLEYQYDNYQDTAILSLDYLDRYLRQEASTDGKEHHPVSYHLWGAGGATYYGLANKDGAQDEIVAADRSFEARALAPGTLEQRPSGTPWTFRGKAGIVRPAEADDVDPLKDVPKPKAGQQAAFIMGDGEIAQTVRFTKAGRYAIAFNAGGSGRSWPGYLPFDVYVDQKKVSPRGQSDARVSTGPAVLGGWGRKTNSLDEEWGSSVFEVDAPGERTIRFVGRGDADEYLALDDVRIASLDAIMESGFDTGEALGQFGEANYERQLRGQAKYARAFGLQVVAYEAGWSLGGDFNQSPIQTWAKLYDPRARTVNDLAVRLFEESGSFMNVWGVFSYWPSWDFENAADYSIMESLLGSSRSLPSEATYGVMLPGSLRPEQADLSVADGARGGDVSWWERIQSVLSCSSDTEQAWHAWMVIAPETSAYSLEVEARGSGTVIVELDGQPLGRFDPAQDGPASTVRVAMTKGAHALRAVLLGEAELSELRVTQRSE